MRIAIDIDSTLHHYWDLFALLRSGRFGVDAPVRRADHVGHHAAAAASRSQALRRRDHAPRAAILAATPYPGAVETVRAWHEAGHFIHITSHRATVAPTATTARGCEQIGLPYDELYCSLGQGRALPEIGIDVLSTTARRTSARAATRASSAATIAHPWNRELCREDEGVICAADWAELRRGLAPLAGAAHHAGLSAAHSFRHGVRTTCARSLHAHQFPRRGRYRLPSTRP